MSSRGPLPFRSKTELVVEHLRDALQAGRYRPGDRLVLDLIARDLSVSKIPVREAITRLTGEGLVELRPNIGPVVPSISSADVLETAMLRVAVEAVALEVAVPLHDSSTLRAVEETLTAMNVGAESFPELNVQFHCALVAPIPHKFIRQNVEYLLRRAQRYAPTSRVPGYRSEAQDEHVALLEGVRAGDVSLVLQLNQTHIRSAARQLATRLDNAAHEQVTGLEAPAP